MTEAEWLTSIDPVPVVEFLSGKISDRKMRLYCVACCRRKWRFFSDDRCRKAVEIAEQFADNEDMIGDLDWAAQGTRLALAEWRAKQGSRGKLLRVSLAAHEIAQSRPHVVHLASQLLGLPVDSARERGVESQQQTHLLQDVAGNPFRPVTLDPRWYTSDVVGLARGIYEERAFDRLPILADALMDAGCDNEDILTHCRSEVPHVRGCWVVDLVLGKS